jgi:hypothetical protein
MEEYYIYTVALGEMYKCSAQHNDISAGYFSFFYADKFYFQQTVAGFSLQLDSILPENAKGIKSSPAILVQDSSVDSTQLYVF